MADRDAKSGPFALRFFIGMGSALLAVLLIWLLGFVLDDVGQFRQIDYASIEKRIIPAEILEREHRLETGMEELARQIAAAGARRDFLRESVTGFQRTMTQMLELQRTSLEKNLPLSDEQQRAIGEAQTSFLANQTEFQTVLEDLLRLEDDRRSLQGEQQTLEREILAKRTEAREQYRKDREWRDLQAALLKILVLLPVILLAVWLFVKKRGSALAPLVYALGVAVLWKLLQIIHAHFPSRYYKYVFLVLAIGVVLKIIMTLIHLSVHPSRRTVTKRRREGYARGRCPDCSYPIPVESTPIPLGSGARGRRVLLSVATAEAPAQPYTCPACGTALFESCPSCQKIRHSLLPRCQHCGAEGGGD